MKHSNEQKFDDELNIFEKKAKELFGADDESLLAEWEAAELEWEQEKLEHPEEARKIEMGADAGFEALMWRIEAERVEKEIEGEVTTEEPEEEPFHEKLETGDSANVSFAGEVSADSNERNPAEENVIPVAGHKKRTRLRGRKKGLLLVAAVCVMVLGMTMGVTATSKYSLKHYLVPDEQSKVISQNANFTIIKAGKLEDAYEQIRKALNIPVLVLSKIPKGMKFERLFLEKEHAIIEFTYHEKWIYFEEAKMPNARGASNLVISDRKVCEDVYNFWLDKEIQIEENILENGLAEYSARIELEESYYYLSGIMEKEVFIYLVEQISNY